jgi:hypothetical protein
MGFTLSWRNWISTLLSAASTKVLLNGNPGSRICHAGGLWQGDPLSMMLFLLVMELLHKLIRCAERWSLLQPLGPWCISYRAALYADDLVLFICPLERYLQVLRIIFDLFEGASGLGCNVQKCHMAPIRCSEAQIALAVAIFPCQVVEFPIRYLGAPFGFARFQGRPSNPSSTEWRQVTGLEGQAAAVVAKSLPEDQDHALGGVYPRGHQHRIAAMVAKSLPEDRDSIPLVGRGG